MFSVRIPDQFNVLCKILSDQVVKNSGLDTRSDDGVGLLDGFRSVASSVLIDKPLVISACNFINFPRTIKLGEFRLNYPIFTGRDVRYFVFFVCSEPFVKNLESLD